MQKIKAKHLRPPELLFHFNFFNSGHQRPAEEAGPQGPDPGLHEGNSGLAQVRVQPPADGDPSASQGSVRNFRHPRGRGCQTR